MATITEGWLKTVPEGLERVSKNTEKKLSGIAGRVGDWFLDALKERQPVGKNDTFASKFPDQNREPRPSLRQGLIPIEQGWVGPTVTAPGSGQRVVTISTNSEHLQFFTTWTGRRHLGTHEGKPQVARNAKTLAFWWQGEGHWPKSAQGGVFIPDSDFVQDAWLATKPYLEEEIKDFASYVIRNAKGEIVE